MNANKIPDIIIGRLPVYLRALQQLSEKGILTTSSQELGEMIGISAAQIRKDISQFGEFGKQGTGYSVPFLIERLRDILKVHRVWEVVIVGMGDIGRHIGRVARAVGMRVVGVSRSGRRPSTPSVRFTLAGANSASAAGSDMREGN